MTNPTNGFSEYRRLILQQLESLNMGLERVGQQLTEVSTDNQLMRRDLDLVIEYIEKQKLKDTNISVQHLKGWWGVATAIVATIFGFVGSLVLRLFGNG